MRSLPQGGIQRTCFDRLERALAQPLRLHRDEPLLGGAKDHRIFAAPAMRITVRQLFFLEQRAVLSQFLNDAWISFEYRLALKIAGFGSKFAFRDPPAPSPASRSASLLRSPLGHGRERYGPSRFLGLG